MEVNILPTLAYDALKDPYYQLLLDTDFNYKKEDVEKYNFEWSSLNDIKEVTGTSNGI